MKISLVIIARASHLSSTNAWIKNNLNAEGGDNLTQPLIGINDPDTAEPTHYGTNYQSLPIGSDAKFKGVVNSPHVSLFVNTPFDVAAASLGLRVKPSRMI